MRILIIFSLYVSSLLAAANSESEIFASNVLFFGLMGLKCYKDNAHCLYGIRIFVKCNITNAKCNILSEKLISQRTLATQLMLSYQTCKPAHWPTRPRRSTEINLMNKKWVFWSLACLLRRSFVTLLIDAKHYSQFFPSINFEGCHNILWIFFSLPR